MAYQKLFIDGKSYDLLGAKLEMNAPPVQPPNSVRFDPLNGERGTCKLNQCRALGQSVLNEGARPGNDYCSHLVTFFKKRGDVLVEPLPELTKIAVPLFRKQKDVPGAVAMISTGMRDDKFGYMPIALALPENVEKDVIDLIGPETGVWSIRNVVIQYIFSQYHMVKPCENDYHSSRHPFGPDYRRVQNAKEPIILVNLYYLLTRGECFHCSTGEDNSDLVPQV